MLRPIGIVFLTPFFLFALDNETWSRVSTSISQPPSPESPLRIERYQHAAAVVGDAMFVWGGRGEHKEHFCSDLLHYSFRTSPKDLS